MVRVIENICDSVDKCKNKSCPYFKDSKEDTRKFIEIDSLRYERPWDKDKIIKEHEIKEFFCAYLNYLINKS